MFVFAGNMLGMVPYSFTYTSHIVVTFVMAAVVFVGVTVIGFMKHGLKFFGFFLPNDVPIFLAPLLIPIEVLSYFTRPVSLALRLFANMTAGHTMLKVFASFVAPLAGARVRHPQLRLSARCLAYALMLRRGDLIITRDSTRGLKKWK
jgi:F-type H+-transporting ATPase subunit a